MFEVKFFSQLSLISIAKNLFSNADFLYIKSKNLSLFSTLQNDYINPHTPDRFTPQTPVAQKIADQC